jgi:hypothetical protein
VDHTARVRRRKTRTNLSRDVERFVFGQPSDPSQQGRQVLAVHVLHRQVQLVAEGSGAGDRQVADVIHAADVGM